VTPTKFSSKVKNLHRPIVLEKAGTYDYEGTLHIWKGDGLCNVFGSSTAAIVIRADGVSVKNFGVKGVPVGVAIMDKEDGGYRKGVSLENLEVKSCFTPLALPKRSVGISIKESILE